MTPQRLNMFWRRDSEGVRAQLGEACGEVMARLSAASTESYSRAYPSLVRLHMLQARCPASHSSHAGPDTTHKQHTCMHMPTAPGLAGSERSIP